MSGGAATDVWTPETSRGDDGALEAIYREFHQPLYRFCLAIVGNRQDAEDALQNTMVKVLRALPGEQREIALKPWLYRIAHNQSIDLLRRRREDVSLEASEPRVGEELAAQVETRERLRHLIADLSALPGRQRETLLMREAGGLSFDEIGAALETSPAVARQTLYEARLGLREMDAGREMECGTVTKALSDGDGRVLRRRDIRAHLRDCDECQRFAEEIDSRRTALAAISPLPAAAAGVLLQGLIGGGAAGGAAVGGAAAGTGGASLVGGAAAKSLGTATLLKGAATVAVVAAIGVGAADRGGLIDLGANPGSKPPAAAEAKQAEPESGVGGSSSSSSPAVGSGRAPEASLDRALRRDGATSRVGEARAATRQSAGDPEAVPANPVSPPSAPEAGGAGPSPGKSGVEHPSGRGHAKQTPAAASHGQETAASHKPEKSKGRSPSGSATSESAAGPGTSAEAPGAVQAEPKSTPAKPPK